MREALPALLDGVSDAKLRAMRRAMAGAWRKLLWTSVHVGAHARGEVPQRAGVSYLGEPPETDAFAALLALLGKRLGLRTQAAVR